MTPTPTPREVGHLARMAFLPEFHVSGRVGGGGGGGWAWLPWSTAQRWGGGALPLRRWGPPPRISRHPAWTPDREPSVLRSVPQGEGAGAGLLHKTPSPVSALSQPPDLTEEAVSRNLGQASLHLNPVLCVQAARAGWFLIPLGLGFLFPA